MCIIVVKKPGVEMPSKSIMEECFSSNPDGAGIMMNYKKKVLGFKGFMTYKDFEAAVAQITEIIPDIKDRSVVMHFRIATHGTKTQHNTHPFPLSDDYQEMGGTTWKSDVGFAHNGIISKYTFHPDIKTVDVSDTMAFGKYVAYPISKVFDVMTDETAKMILDTVCGGKLAFIDGAGRIMMCGHFIEEDGLMFSNNTYKYAAYSYDDYEDTEYAGYSSRSNLVDYKPKDYKPEPKPEPKIEVPTDPANSDDTHRWPRGKAGLMKKDAERIGLVVTSHQLIVWDDQGTYDYEIVNGWKAYNPNTGAIYMWDTVVGEWVMQMWSETINVYDAILNKEVYISEEEVGKKAIKADEELPFQVAVP